MWCMLLSGKTGKNGYNVCLDDNTYDSNNMMV